MSAESESMRSVNIGRDANGAIVFNGDDNHVRVTVVNYYRVTSRSLSERNAIEHNKNPYQGLQAFNEEDADKFFGRTEEVACLWTLFDKLKDSSETRLLPILGPSGSGKSSLVRAGLIPRLAREADPRSTFKVIVFTPGDDPLRRLAVTLSRLTETDSIKIGRKTEDYLHILKAKGCGSFRVMLLSE